ncbi:MAG: hypothetical protein L3J32_09540 [Rhizobiaceae bacterium]|nr:hypothetical protein [Rhizobiaceae bacterium]
MSKLVFKKLRQQFPKVSDSYLESLIEFDSTFSQYFPHFIGEPDTAAFELEWIWTRYSGNPLETVRQSNARKEIKKFSKMITQISAMEHGYWLALSIALSDDKSKTKESQEILLDFILDIVDLNETDQLDATMTDFCASVNIAIDRTHDRSNINWEAVHAVDGLRILWWRNTGKNAPFYLNPASKFAKYLSDGFKVLKVDSDPISAFKRWAAILGSKTKIDEQEYTILRGKKIKHPYDYLVK